MNDEKYMLVALKEAQKAYKKGDVPIGAVIVKNNIIISKGHNQKEMKKNAIKHAEIIAIEKACKKMNSWHLDDCTIYVTLEPCMMCYGAIIQSRIGKIVYGAPNNKFGCNMNINDFLSNFRSNHSVELKSDVLKDKSSMLLKKFFSERR